MSGKELQHIRSDITTWGEAIVAIFTDANARQQILIYGATILGKTFVAVFNFFAKGIAGITLKILYWLTLCSKNFVKQITTVLEFVDKKNASTYKKSRNDRIRCSGTNR